MPDNDFTEFFISGTKDIKNASLVVLIGSWMANRIMQGSMTFVWGLLNCLQIISHFPLININMPANAHTVFMILVEIANIEIIEDADEIINEV